MTDHKTGMLDDIGPEPEAVAPAAEAPQIEAQAPEPQTEQPAEGGDKPERKDNRPEGYVTKGERDRIASELQQERQQRALYEDRFNKVVERFFSQQQPGGQQAAEPEMDLGPDPDVDPIGALAWHREQKRIELEQRRQYEQQTAQQQQQHRQWQEALTTASSQFEEAKAAEPQIQGLYDGLRVSYAREYEALGYPKGQITQLVEQQEAQIIQWAHANRIPIAQAIKNLAGSRGVTAQAAQPQEARPVPEQDPVTGRFVSDADKAARQRESQERNASLSSAPGAPVKKMTGKELASMSEDEMWRQFENVGRKPGAKQFDRDMGFR